MDKPSEPKLFQCSFEGCDASFVRPYKLNRHIRIHKGERPYICDIGGCDKSFTCKFYLAKHKKRPHGNIDMETGCPLVIREKRYNCVDCLKEFKSKFLLKTHRAEHTGEKPFKCDQCEASFAMRSRLKRHKAHHAGFPCDQPDCSQIFEKHNQLRKHIATDHKQINKCHICDKIFTKKCNLKDHIKAHKFNCEIEGCIKSFVRKCQLKEHLDTDHILPKESYNCPDCGTKFDDQLILAQHVKCHANVDSESPVIASKKVIFPYRKSLAQELSGFEADEKDLSDIFTRDKNFRKQGLII